MNFLHQIGDTCYVGWLWGLVSEPRLRPQARLEIEALYDGVDFSETLTRARFEAYGWGFVTGIRSVKIH